MGGHVLASGIFDAPSAVIDALCEGSLAFTPVSLTSTSYYSNSIGVQNQLPFRPSFQTMRFFHLFLELG